MGILRVCGRFGLVLWCAAVAAACGGESSANGAGDGECSSFENDPSWSIGVTIVNRTSETIYLGEETPGCASNAYAHFVVEDPSGAPLQVPSSCLGFCEDMMEGDQLGCPSICLLPEALALAPGEGTSLIWSGLYREDLHLPESCLPAGAEATACNRAAQIEPGTFTFRARAGTEVDCSETIGSCPDCTESENGGCVTGGALISGTLRSAETTVELDASYGVGPGGGGGATLPVEIVFEDPSG